MSPSQFGGGAGMWEEASRSGTRASSSLDGGRLQGVAEAMATMHGADGLPLNCSRPQPGAWVTDSECYFVRGADTAALASAGNNDGTWDQFNDRKCTVGAKGRRGGQEWGIGAEHQLNCLSGRHLELRVLNTFGPLTNTTLTPSLR
ncbi:hypothetical protein X797_010299 [Metarhizium robertsii]|uniref:Uncharacterized protein n=1 Tax=Metarhizium robertsii TaxID=568076 RepID=A0A014PKW4_9HYPO|nr:hypothetical protein X797_010299 [Metarhizium robertsii]